MSEQELWVRETERRDGFEIGGPGLGVVLKVTELELTTDPRGPDFVMREAVERARKIVRVRRFREALDRD